MKAQHKLRFRRSQQASFLSHFFSSADEEKGVESGDGDTDPWGALGTAQGAQLCQLLPWHWGLQDYGSPWPHMWHGPHIERSAGREVAHIQA